MLGRSWDTSLVDWARGQELVYFGMGFNTY